MPIDYSLDPVAAQVPHRLTADRLRELLETKTLIVSEQDAPIVTVPPSEDLHDDELDAMARNIDQMAEDMEQFANDPTMIFNPVPAARQPEPTFRMLRVTYRASTTDGEIIDTYDLLTHRRYVRTITETLREIGDHINRIYISGPRYGTVRCIERFLEALIAVTYLKGQSLMSITDISIL